MAAWKQSVAGHWAAQIEGLSLMALNIEVTDTGPLAALTEASTEAHQQDRAAALACKTTGTNLLASILSKSFHWKDNAGGNQ